VGIAHWDDVQKRRHERGQMAGTWSDLGSAAGSYRCGARRLELGSGEMPTPAHVHGEAEELFYVLGGSGLTWLDGKAFEVRAGDCVLYKNFHEAHTIRGGDDGLDVLAFGAREYLAAGELPRGATMWSVTGWVEVHTDSHPWDREPELVWPEPEPERPATIANVADVEPEVRGGRRRRFLGRATGSRWTGLTQIELDAGTLSGPPHCHSAEEEIFVVLDGEGTLELTPSPGAREPGVVEGGQPVRAGSVVARPPGSGVAHAFRAGEGGMTLLAWGTREPNDICWYPRSQKLFWRGVGVIGRIETLDYWDGEELT
jgi:uncharacterized cupin superfamily protein